MNNKISLTVFDSYKDSSYPVEVLSSDKVSKIKGVVQFYTNVGVKYQMLIHHGVYLLPDETVSSRNIQNNDILQVQYLPPLNKSNPLTGVNLQSISVDNLRRYILSYEDLRIHVQTTIPDLYRAVTATSPNLLQGYVNQLRGKARNTNNINLVQPPPPQRQLTKEQIRENRIQAKLRENPMDIEAQKELEQLIRERNVNESEITAKEFRPELFLEVHMLYIRGMVNGVKVKVFVDSGAQMTIMGKKFAEECGVMRLCDNKYKGVALGVGSAAIVGRVHLFRIRLGDSVFEHNLTILDSDMRLLLGLDFLKAHRCIIDLGKNNLCIGNEKIPFLNENEVPKDISSSRSPMSPGGSNLTDDKKIQLLMGMGVSRDKAVELLKKTNGNVDFAASLLFDGM